MGIGDSNAIPVVEPNGAVRHPGARAVVSRAMAGETLAVPVPPGVDDLATVYTFNELGVRLWLMLGQGRSMEELTDWVQANYAVSAERAFADVARLVAELREERRVRTA